LFDVTFDFCALSNGSNDGFLKMWWPNIQQDAGQFMHACPYKVNTMRTYVILEINNKLLFKEQISVHNLTFDGTAIPTFAVGKFGYKTDITFMDGRSLKIFTVVFYGDIVYEKN
jgi:hypothetical protein